MTPAESMYVQHFHHIKYSSMVRTSKYITVYVLYQSILITYNGYYHNNFHCNKWKFPPRSFKKHFFKALDVTGKLTGMTCIQYCNIVQIKKI